MELTNEFVVAVPIDEAWTVLTDIERIAPCMPGAELREVEGDEHRGLVKVKVGPITASYRGAAKFLELDQAGRRAVLKAEGRETRGQGNATAMITATLVSEGGGTKVEVSTDLAITGKVAQFGRGVLAEVSAKLLDQFVRNLETTVLAPASSGSDSGREDARREAPAIETEMPAARKNAARSAPPNEMGGPTAVGGPPTAATAATTAPSGLRRIESSPAQPVDLVDVAGLSLMRRLLPFTVVAGVVVLARVVIYVLPRRKS